MATKKPLTYEQVKATVEPEVLEVKSMELELAKLEAGLAKNSKFRKFLDLQKQLNETAEKTWANVLATMEQNSVKKIEGSWGSISVAEKTTWDTTDELPKEFYKTVPDAKAISDYAKLTGEVPAGATPKVTRYLHKRFK